MGDRKRTDMNALLLYPEFSAQGFLNYKTVCQLMGAKYPAFPLGMITMACCPSSPDSN